MDIDYKKKYGIRLLEKLIQSTKQDDLLWVKKHSDHGQSEFLTYFIGDEKINFGYSVDPAYEDERVIDGFFITFINSENVEYMLFLFVDAEDQSFKLANTLLNEIENSIFKHFSINLEKFLNNVV